MKGFVFAKRPFGSKFNPHKLLQISLNRAAVDTPPPHTHTQVLPVSRKVELKEKFILV